MCELAVRRPERVSAPELELETRYAVYKVKLCVRDNINTAILCGTHVHVGNTYAVLASAPRVHLMLSWPDLHVRCGGA